MTATPSNQPFDRSGLLSELAPRGAAFVVEYSHLVDEWLSGLFHDVFGTTGGVALVATGGQGLAELSPHSDLDLALVHAGLIDPGLAQNFWYPVWDAGFKLGHSVRSIPEALALASDDLATATSLLSVRWLAGDTDIARRLADQATAQWRKRAKPSLVVLADSVDERHGRVPDVAYALEPDLKEGRGGLRDVHALRWAQATGLLAVDELRGLTDSYQTLLGVRVELHRVAGRPGDRLLLQYQDEVATRLDDPNADVLMSRVASAARAIGWASDECWFEARRQLGTGRWSRRDRPKNLDHGIELIGGRIELGPDSDLSELSVLRVGVAAASNGARISRATLRALADAPLLSDPWPAEALALLISLLALGDDAVPVIETLDEAGLWCLLLPEWTPNRCKPQRNVYHRFTVDRHLLEATARAADLQQRVERSDLLVVGALLHDIGKGYPGDHTEVGMVLAHTIARRMGFDANDVETLVLLVEHHLLLPDIATRRDLDDPATLRWVAACAGTVERLHLLHALTEADSIATGPSAWGSWKAGLVATLVERTQHVLNGGDVGELTDSPERQAELDTLIDQAIASSEPIIRVDGDQVTVVCADRPGLFSRIAGVLATCGLDVSEASANGERGFVIDRFRVTSDLGGDIAWAKVELALVKALTGRMSIDSRLAERARVYAKAPIQAHHLRPKVRVLNEASDDATVVEVTGPDSIGLLYRLTRALADLEIDIGRAKAVTMGGDVVDAFYVRDATGAKNTDPDDVGEIRQALLHALAPITG